MSSLVLDELLQRWLSENYNNKQYLTVKGMMNPLNSQIDQELARILAPEANKELLQQIKTIENYQASIQEQLILKSGQISELNFRLREEIQGVQRIAKENELLKMENSRLRGEQEDYIRNLRQAQSAKENLKVENQELKSINEQHLKKIEDLLRRIATLTNNLSMQMVRKNQETQTVQQQKTKKQTQENRQFKELANSSSQTQQILQSNQLLKRISILQKSLAGARLEKHQLQTKLFRLDLNEVNIGNRSVITDRNEAVNNESKQLSSILCGSSPSQNHSSFSSSACSANQLHEGLLSAISELQRGTLKQVRYQGETILGRKNGKGQCEYSNGLVYRGQFEEGKRNGLGILCYKNHIIYTGYWKDDQFHGRGELLAVEDERVAEYHGHFQRGKRHGYGTNFFKDGKKILNLYSNDLPFGTGLEGSYLIDDEKAATQIELSSIL